MSGQMIERPFKIHCSDFLMIVTRHGVAFATSPAERVALEEFFKVEAHAFDKQKLTSIRKCVVRMGVFYSHAKLLRKFLQLIRRWIGGKPSLHQFRTEEAENASGGHRIKLN